METVGNARVAVSVKEGKVEIEGSEAFVADQLTRLKPLIAQVIATSGKLRPDSPREQTRQPNAHSQSFGKFAKLYHATADGKIELLKEIPGNNMAHKTVSAALLVSHANSLLGSDSTAVEVIRAACKDHACHDSNNFSATLKREKELFVHSGGSHITLSETGRELAEDLAERLIAA